MDPADRSTLVDITSLDSLDVWGTDVQARVLVGANASLAVVELAPGALVPSHHHVHEQLGICLQGSGTFTIDGETRDIGPGTTWRILGGLPHDLVVGPEGAVVIDVFTPVRDDWDDRPTVDGAAPRWPDA